MGRWCEQMCLIGFVMCLIELALSCFKLTRMIKVQLTILLFTLTLCAKSQNILVSRPGVAVIPLVGSSDPAAEQVTTQPLVETEQLSTQPPENGRAL